MKTIYNLEEIFLTNQDVANPGVDIISVFGVAVDLPTAGDFDGDSKDTIGVWRPSVGTFFLSNNNVAVDITPRLVLPVINR